MEQVFTDVDLTVKVMRNPTLTRQDGSKYVYNGLVFQVNCQDCETPTQMGLEWGEIRAILEGRSLQGVQRTQNGWVFSVQCQNTEEGCKFVNRFEVTDEEMERHAALEVARRQRVAQAQGQGNPFPNQQQPAQVPRRAMQSRRS